MKKAVAVMSGGILANNLAGKLEESFDVIRLFQERDPESILKERRNDIVAIASSHSVTISRTLIEALPNLEIISQFAVG